MIGAGGATGFGTVEDGKGVNGVVIGVDKAGGFASDTFATGCYGITTGGGTVVATGALTSGFGIGGGEGAGSDDFGYGGFYISTAIGLASDLGFSSAITTGGFGAAGG